LPRFLGIPAVLGAKADRRGRFFRLGAIAIGLGLLFSDEKNGILFDELLSLTVLVFLAFGGRFHRFGYFGSGYSKGNCGSFAFFIIGFGIRL
jgi:hypothetical protein